MAATIQTSVAIDQPQMLDPGFIYSKPFNFDGSSNGTSYVDVYNTSGVNDLKDKNANGELFTFVYDGNNKPYWINPGESYFVLRGSHTAIDANGKSVNWVKTTDAKTTFVGNSEEIFLKTSIWINDKQIEEPDNVRGVTMVKAAFTSKGSLPQHIMKGYFPETEEDSLDSDQSEHIRTRMASTEECEIVDGAPIEIFYYFKPSGCGFFNDLPKYYYKGTTIKVEFTRNDIQKLYAKAAGAQVADFKITRMIWKLQTREPTPEVAAAYMNMMTKGIPMRYQIPTMRTRAISIPTNSGEIVQQIGNFPSRPHACLITFQKASRNAAPTKTGAHANPNVFDLIPDLERINIKVDGDIYPKPYQYSWNQSAPERITDGNILEVMDNFYRFTGRLNDNQDGSIVTYDNFDSLYPFFVFNFSKNGNGFVMPELNNDSSKLEIEAKWKTALTEEYTMFCVFFFNTVFSIQQIGALQATTIEYGRSV